MKEGERDEGGREGVKEGERGEGVKEGRGVKDGGEGGRGEGRGEGGEALCAHTHLEAVGWLWPSACC